MRHVMQLQEVYEGLYDGPHATPKPSDVGPVFLGIKNITEDGRLDLTCIRHISEEEYPKWTKRVTPQEGDIVFSYEATLHRYAIIPKGFRGCLGRRMALIRPDTKKVNTKYLFYYFFSSDWREEVGKYILTGATVDRIPLTKTPEFQVNLPSKEQQDEIAGLIDTYTNLIENNNRRIAILEEMAQSLYREWFVKFRFPGFENTKFIDSPLGKIPEGWKVRSINSFIDIKSGFAFKSKTFVPGGEYQLITIKNVKDGQFILASDSRIDDLPPKLPDYCHLKTSDVLLSLTGNVGRACLVYGENYLLNQRVAKLVPKELGRSAYIYFMYRQPELQKRLEMLSTGVAQQNLSPVNMGELEVIYPANEQLNNYTEIASPVISQMLALWKKNDNLRAQRDLLLPKLISGKINCI